MVLCNDGTLYCGITTDLEERLKQHNLGKGAKYTKARRPVRLVWFNEWCLTKSEASQIEYHIKKLSRTDKWKIIRGEKIV